MGSVVPSNGRRRGRHSRGGTSTALSPIVFAFDALERHQAELCAIDVASAWLRHSVRAGMCSAGQAKAQSGDATMSDATFSTGTYPQFDRLDLSATAPYRGMPIWTKIADETYAGADAQENLEAHPD